ncbi:MAG TPA: ATP-dependent helicase, partial [Acidimicrobiales bacterium]|nr:ATP-dependent helicase [Acidimicrobiales bacterium]
MFVTQPAVCERGPHSREDDCPEAWAAGLNRAQQIAAAHGDQPLLVLAGAGTGKTRALVSRLACLLHRGAAPERVLLLTFARRAADEMLLRAGDLAGGRRAVGGTFHSVAHRAVSTYTEVLGFPGGFSVLGPSEASDLMELMRADYGLAGLSQRFPRAATLVEIYSRCINSGRLLSEVLELSYPWCERHRENMASLFSSFTARKREGALVDFDDLLLYWRALLSQEKLGPQLAEQFDYVLVDEYQDLNHLQVDIVRLLSPQGRGLTVVGDEAQAIYGFRGGGPAELRQLVLGYQGATVVRLEENFRSYQGILDVANVVRSSCGGP